MRCELTAVAVRHRPGARRLARPSRLAAAQVCVHGAPRALSGGNGRTPGERTRRSCSSSVEHHGSEKCGLRLAQATISPN
jgi:hypothetical protein